MRSFFFAALGLGKPAVGLEDPGALTVPGANNLNHSYFIAL